MGLVRAGVSYLSAVPMLGQVAIVEIHISGGVETIVTVTQSGVNTHYITIPSPGHWSPGVPGLASVGGGNMLSPPISSFPVSSLNL